MQSKLHDLDKRGVKAFVKQNNDTGKYGIECWRKKTKKELDEDFAKHNIPIDNNYKMIREGSTQSYFTRSEALEESIKLAERICLEYNF